MATCLPCSRALRVLGQTLDTMGVEVFDIRSRDNHFHLQCGDPAPPHREIIETIYSPSDLWSSEFKARAARRHSSKNVDVNRLAEILRAAGRYVESKEGRLLRVCNCESPWEQDAIKLEYATRDGRTYVEEFSPSAMSDYATRMRRERTRVQHEHTRK